MKNITFVFFIIVISVRAQDYLKPILATSFGINHHTNRDISYFSVADHLGNTFNIGTTERDSTLTDIITTKFDQELNLLWQKIFSVDTNSSYDLPIAVHVDSDNNLIVIGRSTTYLSRVNGLLFVVKYNQDGDELWSKVIGNLDGSDYLDYRNFNSILENDILSIIYTPIDYDNVDSSILTKFLKIGTDGSIQEEFNMTFSNIQIQGTYKDGLFYALIFKYDENDQSEFYLKKIGAGVDETYRLDIQSDFVPEHFTTDFKIYQMHVDGNGNLYIVVPVSQEYNGSLLSYTKINSQGEIEYSIGTSSTNDLVGSYLDVDESMNLIYYNNTNQQLTFKKLNDTGGDLQAITYNYNNLTGSKFNDDHSFFATNANNQITLFNTDLSLVNSFQYSGLFSITDIAKVNDETVVVSGTTYDKMYPESDFFSKDDIILEQLGTTQILNSFIFSGNGTSRAVRQRLLIDNNNNYIIACEEKLGPDNYHVPWGSKGPVNKSIRKYDSGFNLLWKVELPSNVIDHSNWILDQNNNIYINSFVKDDIANLIKLSSDGDILFSVPSQISYAVYFDQNSLLNVVSLPIPNSTTVDNDTVIYAFNPSTGSLTNSTLFEGLELLRSFTSSNGDSYLYMYTGPNSYGDTSPRMDVYKNQSLDFSINLNMHGTYESIALGTVDINPQNGDLYFFSSWGQIDEQLQRITLSGAYTNIALDYGIGRLKVLENGKVFTFADPQFNEIGPINIYNSDLSLFKNIPDDFYIYSFVMEMKGFIFLNSHYDNRVKVLDQDGQLIDVFKLISELQAGILDANDDLILTGSFGDKLWFYSEYSWERGLLHKYEYNGPTDADEDGVSDSLDLCPDTPNGESVDQNGCSESQLDDDSDGVTNNLDNCPNTPQGENVDANGCSDTQLDDDNDGVNNANDLCPNSTAGSAVDANGCFTLPANNFIIETVSETCLGKNNATITITALESHNYSVTLNGINHDFSTTLTIDNLPPGDYNFCILVPAENYEQCFFLTLAEGTTITGSIFDGFDLTIVNIVSGTPPFTVYINSNLTLQTLASTFTLNTKAGDTVKIVSDKDCEGVLSKSIGTSLEPFVYPNPSKGHFNITLPRTTKEVLVDLYGIQGQLISSGVKKVIDGTLDIDLDNRPNGVYFVKVHLEKTIVFKLIKY